MRAIAEELASVACACCGTPVPYRANPLEADGGRGRPRCVSCPTCGFKYRLVVRALPKGGAQIQPRPV